MGLQVVFSKHAEFHWLQKQKRALPCPARVAQCCCAACMGNLGTGQPWEQGGSCLQQLLPGALHNRVQPQDAKITGCGTEPKQLGQIPGSTGPTLWGPKTPALRTDMLSACIWWHAIWVLPSTTLLTAPVSPLPPARNPGELQRELPGERCCWVCRDGDGHITALGTPGTPLLPSAAGGCEAFGAQSCERSW